MRRKDVARLERIAERIEAEETQMQKIYGDAVKGSQRRSLWLDAKAIRDILANLPN